MESDNTRVYTVYIFYFLFYEILIIVFFRIGKVPVDVTDLSIEYLTIVGHKLRNFFAMHGMLLIFVRILERLVTPSISSKEYEPDLTHPNLTSTGSHRG